MVPAAVGREYLSLVDSARGTAAYCGSNRHVGVGLANQEESMQPVLKRVLYGICRAQAMQNSDTPCIRMPIKWAYKCGMGDVAVDHNSAASYVKIHLKKSKCDQFGAGADILLGCTGCDLCPVTAIVGYVNQRGKSPLVFRFDPFEPNIDPN